MHPDQLYELAHLRLREDRARRSLRTRGPLRAWLSRLARQRSTSQDAVRMRDTNSVARQRSWTVTHQPGSTWSSTPT